MDFNVISSFLLIYLVTESYAREPRGGKYYKSLSFYDTILLYI